MLHKIKHIVAGRQSKPRVVGNFNYQHNYIFIHVPKNAGTSVYRALGFKKTYHTTALQYQQALGDAYEKFFSFCFVRNPFDRFISLYNYARMDESYYHSSINPSASKFGKHLDYDILKHASLEEAVNLLIEGKLLHDKTWNHWQPQTAWITDANNNIIVDYIGRVEDIRLDFRNICNNIGLTDFQQLQSHNESAKEKKDYRQLIGKDMRNKLENYYADDLKLLGYTFDNNCNFY